MPEQETKYQQVVDWVRRKIEDGTYKDGDRLLSENELSERFGLSRQTVRHAMGELERSRLITRVRGSGTYIGAAPAAVSAPGQVQREKYRNIAVVSTFYESYIFMPIILGIEKVLSEHNYTMQVSFTVNRIRREKNILQTILEKDHIDGLIVEPVKSSLPNQNLRYYEKLRERGIPILFFNAFYPGFSAPCVRLDDVKVAQKATHLLIDAGHRKIGGIFKCDDGQGHLRYEGYLKALTQAGLAVGQRRVVWVDTPAALDLSQFGDYLFKRLEGCTAVMCYNDEIACQVAALARERGIRIPEDLSLVGIDNADMAGTGPVPLTSFPHPKEELGWRAGENMIRMIEQPGFDGNYLFDSRPVLRDSVAKLG